MSKNLIVTTPLQKRQLISIPEDAIDLTDVYSRFPTVESLGVEYGTNGSYTKNSRMWGVTAKTGADTNSISSYGMAPPTEVPGSGTVSPTAANPYPWNSFDQVGLNTVCGWKSAGNISFIQRPRLKCLINNSSAFAANRRIWVSWSSAYLDAVGAGGDATKTYVGLRYDPAVGANWYLCSSTGAAASEVDTTIPCTQDVNFHIDLNFEDPALLKAVINGNTITKSTNLPSSTSVVMAKWQTTAIVTQAAIGVRFLIHHVMINHN